MFLGVWWNPFSWGSDIINGILSVVYGFLIMIDCIIYSFVSYIYQIFLVLAQGGDILDDRFVGDLVNRVYIIIGVVMLFIIAYSLLKAMLNLDDLTKGKNSPVNIIKDVIISVVLIAVLPTIFDFAYAFQGSLLINNTIGKIIIGDGNGTNSANTISEGGYLMGKVVFKAFMHATEGYCDSKEEEIAKKGLDGQPCEIIQFDSGITFGDLWNDAADLKTFFAIMQVGPKMLTGEISYYYIISTVAGIFVLFVLLSYCLDMALRLVKLAVYELIAPIPILARLVPSEQAKKVFSNWVKATLSTFTEVFIRVAILYFAVLVISSVTASLNDFFSPLLSGTASIDVLLLAQALIVIGVILFVKQAPEIIKEITGLDGGKYNPLKSAKQGLSLLAGGAFGGSPLAGLRAWEQAGKSKDLLDFSAIGNQYKRKQAAKEAKMQGASRTDRMYDSLRKRFGFDTQLDEANKRLERGLGMDGEARQIKNDTEADITITLEDGSIKTLEKGKDYGLDEKTLNGLQHQKDLNTKELSKKDEEIRHLKEGQALNQKYIDLRGKIKKKALEKINEGHNHITDKLLYAKKDPTTGDVLRDTNGDIILEELLDEHGNSLGQMNYAAMKAYQESRIAAGADADELAKIKDAVMRAEDRMWVNYSEWAITGDKGGEISTWYDQAINYHDKVGIFDTETQQTFRFDRRDIHQKMDFFEGSNIRFINADGTEYKGKGTVQKTGKGFDKTAKANVNGADTEIQKIEITKVEFDDANKRIDRVLKKIEEAKTEDKSSATYQRYKASDNANKINDSGKN